MMSIWYSSLEVRLGHTSSVDIKSQLNSCVNNKKPDDY